MNYTTRDYIGEIASYNGALDIKQTFRSTISDYEKIEDLDGDHTDLIDRFKYLLDLNDYVRVESKSIYKLHKGYPSPRSLYPLKLFLSLGNRLFVSKNDVNNQIEYFRNNNYNAAVLSLAIEFRDLYPDYYSHNKKSLLLLEMGHFLCNILLLSEIMGITYVYTKSSNRIQLDLIEDELWKIDNMTVDRFVKTYTNRNSGLYSHGITDTQNVCFQDHHNLLSTIQQSVRDINDFFGFKYKEGIKILVYHNTGYGQFISSDNESVDPISYRKMNEIYPYVNFYGVSFCVFFLLDNRAISDDNLTEYLLSLGYLSQILCLDYSNKTQYCRPLKSFNIEKIERLSNINSSLYTPFYYLIAANKN